ncbi:MAG: hypothetical protein ACLFTT_02670 [Candidatus Hydrogenedentota bacterium]
MLQALIIAVAAACAGYLSHGDTLGDTAFSRLASAYSLVHHGTWVIGHDPDMPPNPCADFTVDKVEIDGKLYSTKPPLLPLMMAGEYWLAHHLLGWDLAERDDLRALLRVMVLTLVTLPYILALLCFAAMLRWLLPNPWLRVYLLFALAFGTQLIGFATHIDNHVPAAGMLMAALWCALGPATGHAPAHRWRFFGFGLAAGLVFTFDMPITIFIVPPGLYLLYRFPRYAFTWGALGVLAPLAVHFGVMLAVTGSPLPVQMRPELYLYEASYWRNPTGLDALCEPKSLYFFHMHVGRFGSFTLFPVLWFGIAGTLLAAFKRDTRCRGWVLAGLLAFLVLTLYYVLRTNNYGGAAYGFRWHIAAMPVLLLMGVPILRRVRRPWHWVVLLLLLAMSCYSAWECTRTPWGVHQEWTCRVFGTSY